MSDFDAADVALFAVSYDPVAVLAAFSHRRGIAFDLLSDENSRVIEDLGLLNRHVEQQQDFFGMPVKERHLGIPYPGAFLLDEHGTVIAKYFEQSYRDRPSGEYFLHDLGAEVTGAAEIVRARDAGIEFAAWSVSGVFRPLEKSVLHLRIGLEEGRHAYVAPAPPGYATLSVEMEPQEGVRAGCPRLPAGRPHMVHGLDEQFQVVEGVVDLAVPYTIAGRLYLPDGRPRREPLKDREVIVTLRVAYQTCTDHECSPPAEQRLQLRLREADLVGFTR